VQAALRQIAFLDGEIEAVERLIAKEMLASPEARRLMTVPGVNLIATAPFLAAVAVGSEGPALRVRDLPKVGRS
jgi:transposase